MIMDAIMPSCLEVTRRLAEGELDHSPWYSRALIRLHLSMCRHCARFARQLSHIAQALRDKWRKKPDSAKLAAIQQRIATRLKQR